uniref:Transcription elongation factor 1 homolog n=1 Tax=Lotharella oceanica TaxID=641309 RepID=A0A7S2TKA4_9EUKA
MGKRKSKAKVIKKAKRKTAEIFDCPFCNHKGTVECIIEQKRKLATLKCRRCGAQHQMQPITMLTKPIDVFSDWIDAAEEANKDFDDYPVESKEQGKGDVEEDDRDYDPGYEDDDGLGGEAGGAGAAGDLGPEDEALKEDYSD